MRKALVTISIGDLYEKLSKLTHPSLKAYADKIGAEFIVLKDLGSHKYPQYVKLDLGEMLDDYDQIMYVDSDILVREDAPDLMDATPIDHMALFEEGKFQDRTMAMSEFLYQHGVDHLKWNQRYFNTGVMIFSKEHRGLFVPPKEEIDNFKEQTYLNMQIHLQQPKIRYLHYKFNRMAIMEPFTGEQRYDSYFMHYAGHTGNVPDDKFIAQVKGDIEVWKEHKDNHVYQKRIAIILDGGRGDQVETEPVIRYIRDKVYKGDDIALITPYSEIFDHLGLPIYKVTNVVPHFKERYSMQTSQAPDHHSFVVMSPLLTHSTDFASLQLLRRTLPLKMKTVIQKYEPEHLAKVEKVVGGSFDNLVVVHAGRSWPSRTFPPAVWRSYIDALLAGGYRVALIGKEVFTGQGVVEFDRTGCIDLVDKLSYKETLALLDKSKVLVTNDSGPVHMAGAFDNWIGLISTVRHPEHVLPHRHGDVWYKAKALEIKPMYDNIPSAPSLIYGSRASHCDPKALLECLPSAQDILHFVDRCFKQGEMLL